MGKDVLLGFYTPRVFTAGEALKAGHVVKPGAAEEEVLKNTTINDAIVGVVLTDAASGDKVTVVHGVWLTNVSGTLARGKLEPDGAGGVQAYTSGNAVGFCTATGNGGELFIY